MYAEDMDMTGLSREQVESYKNIMSVVFDITAERPIAKHTINHEPGKNVTMTIEWHPIGYKEMGNE